MPMSVLSMASLFPHTINTVEEIREHHCRTPQPIEHALDRPSSNLTYAA